MGIDGAEARFTAPDSPRRMTNDIKEGLVYIDSPASDGLAAFQRSGPSVRREFEGPRGWYLGSKRRRRGSEEICTGGVSRAQNPQQTGDDQRGHSEGGSWVCDGSRGHFRLPRAHFGTSSWVCVRSCQSGPPVVERC